MIHGNESQREDVLKRAIAAEPTYGEKWIAVSKDVKNATKSVEDKLKMVAAGLENNL